MKRMLLVVAIVGVMATVSAGAANAGGPNQAVFEQSSAWACESAAGLPPSHCVNVKSQGDTGNIKVFAPDPRGPQESLSFNPKADSRPCPHDPDADPDGTWWQVPGDGPYVCHHRP
jgi:hypothetical protein